MNNNFEKNLEKFKAEINRVGLSETEKAKLRHRVLFAIRNLPVRKGELGGRISETGSRPVGVFNLIFAKPMPVLLVIALLLSGGGVSFAAERALPGDFLYPVKVAVNEEVRTVFAFSPEAKSQWEVRRLERRLAEAVELAKRGDLPAQARETLEKRIEKSTERTRELVARLEARGNVEAVARVLSDSEAALNAHEAILSKLREGKDGELSKLILRVRGAGELASTTRARLGHIIASSTAPRAEAAANGMLKAAEEKLSEVKDFISKVEAKIGGTNIKYALQKLDAAKSQLAEAQNSLADGEKALEAKNFAEAFRLFQRAHREAQEAKYLAQEAASVLDVQIERRDLEEIRDQLRGAENTGEGRDSR